MISIGKKWLFGVVALSVLRISNTAHAITLHTSDFIPNVTRTNFNSFEGLPGTYTFWGSYTEDGIKVEQMSHSGNGILTVGQLVGSYSVS